MTYLTPSLRSLFRILSLTIVLAAAAGAQTKDECLACHNDNSLTMERAGKDVSLFVNPAILNRSPHARQNCIACHTGFDAENVPHKEKITPVRCSSCHANAEMKHQFHAAQLRAEKKRGALDQACKKCHGTHNVVAPSAGKGAGSCETCHTDVVGIFSQSAHGKALASGQPGAPKCTGCHSHDITYPAAGADTAAVKRAQERVCLSCHLDNPDVRARMTTAKNFVRAYDMSVHGAALQRGNGRAASCVDCHGSHAMQPGFKSESSTNKTHIPELCGKCHQAISKEYTASSHGIALREGVKDAPSCTDCHGEHSILRPDDPSAAVNEKNVSARICTPCHSSVRLSEKYGISTGKVASYNASFHGLAQRGGQKEVANCASCHSVHNIRPSSDPASTVNKANLATTCGKCHPGANEAFTVGKIHVTESETDEPLLYWISTIYLIMIFVIIGGMLVHNIADFRRKAIHKLKVRRGAAQAPHHVSHRLYVRMTGNERLQHVSLLVSFFVLVFTGFMLRFPDAWWVVLIRGLSDSVFDARSVIHRVAGAVMIAASVYHVGYLAFTKRGRQLFMDLLPRLSDATDAIAVLKYNFGFSKVKPKFDRFSYIEKSEYWALVWGNIVMGATGFIMWFDNYFMGILTKLGWDIARTVHYYEAWLAFLAILVWHIYFVIFNPDAYPMNLAWLKGTLSEEEMADEHALELERIKAAEESVSIAPDVPRDDAPTM
ncbi:MAG: cytochrome b/b6 domain-containing protein [Ignavibacteriae bacterium]|nr:cytochrome b/b6 domain-containing protein [Ignavibacteriota bacterium]